MPKIAITTTSFAKYDDQPLQRLKDSGFKYVLNPYGRTLSCNEVVELAADAIGIIAGTETLDRYVLERLSKLKSLSRCGAGVDNIDLEAAAQLKINIYNTPFGPTIAVAELTVGLILNLLRKVTMMDREMRSGIWKKHMGNLLSGKKIGVIGFGRIGQKTGSMLVHLGCRVFYYDTAAIDTGIEELKTLSIKKLGIDDLLRKSDLVVIHVSGKYEKPLLDAKKLSIMRKGAWLVNTARASVVDQSALFDALKEGHLAGAALDVFEKEPYNGPLKKLDNVLLTPHIGSYAKEARVEMERTAVENLLKGLRKEGLL